jgi:arylsulfatase
VLTQIDDNRFRSCPGAHHRRGSGAGHRSSLPIPLPKFEGKIGETYKESVPAWDSLNDDQKKLYTALFENFAGYFAFTDHEIGRLLNAVKELPDADNTLVIYIVGDNGASAEGGPDGTLNEIKGLNGISTAIEEILPHLNKLGGPETEPHYPVGWAWAGNTPFQWVKQVASHLGGTRNPMVVSWPAKIKHDDKPRDAFLHLVDVVPTILEAAHLPMPKTVNGIEQKPLAGKSFLASFTDPNFKGRSEQYFEVFSNRSIYEDGWKANAQHTLPWSQDLAPGNWDKDRWELYNLDKDFSEANDLAEEMPDKLAELKTRFDEAADEKQNMDLDRHGEDRRRRHQRCDHGLRRRCRWHVAIPQGRCTGL